MVTAVPLMFREDTYTLYVLASISAAKSYTAYVIVVGMLVTDKVRLLLEVGVR